MQISCLEEKEKIKRSAGGWGKGVYYRVGQSYRVKRGIDVWGGREEFDYARTLFVICDVIVSFLLSHDLMMALMCVMYTFTDPLDPVHDVMRL